MVFVCSMRLGKPAPQEAFKKKKPKAPQECFPHDIPQGFGKGVTILYLINLALWTSREGKTCRFREN